ncbi:hypothetical protein SKAU_G00108620 [Synaphobranchus kaupii]|uniref:Uncharacterized protein n=1 Tax=Synaphobranchus kaupii TaxID=118154 RepID=A0A9Q1J7U8_SYNKA|nr:hypothetical protein SKAU_G00108620 [Synaphobranchus kaupii]
MISQSIRRVFVQADGPGQELSNRAKRSAINLFQAPSSALCVRHLQAKRRELCEERRGPLGASPCAPPVWLEPAHMYNSEGPSSEKLPGSLQTPSLLLPLRATESNPIRTVRDATGTVAPRNLNAKNE